VQLDSANESDLLQACLQCLYRERLESAHEIRSGALKVRIVAETMWLDRRLWLTQVLSPSDEVESKPYRRMMTYIGYKSGDGISNLYNWRGAKSQTLFRPRL
jgi:hypothetical protein